MFRSRLCEILYTSVNHVAIWRNWFFSQNEQHYNKYCYNKVQHIIYCSLPLEVYISRQRIKATKQLSRLCSTAVACLTFCLALHLYHFVHECDIISICVTSLTTEDNAENCDGKDHTVIDLRSKSRSHNEKWFENQNQDQDHNTDFKSKSHFCMEDQIKIKITILCSKFYFASVSERGGGAEAPLVLLPRDFSCLSVRSFIFEVKININITFLFCKFYSAGFSGGGGGG